MDNIYPIGSIFISTNTTNPSTYFGGKWERIKGRFLLAADDSAYKIGSTGGEATVTLTVEQIPPHYHWIDNYNSGGWPTGYMTVTANGKTGYGSNVRTGNTGGGQAHNNMPPYLVVYIWKRIS